jgi:hypothetical protein
MNLPTTKTPPTQRDPRIIVLYGAPKVGKTTILSQLDSCLIVDNEHGTDYLEALKIQVANVQELRELSAELKKHPMTYKRIALDTVTTLEDWAEEQATTDYKNSTVGKKFSQRSVLMLPNGGGYFWLRQTFKDLIKLFSGTTGSLILVAHLREKLLEQEGGEVTAKDIELTGKCRTIICSLADTVGYLFRHPKDHNKLMVRFAGDENVVCSSRCEHLKGQTFPFDWNKIFLNSPTNPTETIETYPPVV